MINLHIFTEEPSIKNVFDAVLPKILPEGVNYSIHTHQGKQDLEKAILTTVPTISRIPNSKILITRDQDIGNCIDIKNRIIDLVSQNCTCEFYVRIVCKELESWFLGDLDAVGEAYRRFKPENFQNKSKLRNVDNIQNPGKYLKAIIPEHFDKKTLPKLETSEKISRFMRIEKNRSPSFNNTIKAIISLTQM